MLHLHLCRQSSGLWVLQIGSSNSRSFIPPQEYRVSSGSEALFSTSIY